MKTYWLNGKDGYDKPLPGRDIAVSLSQHEFKQSEGEQSYTSSKSILYQDDEMISP